MLYKFLKFLFGFALRQFFCSIRRSGAEPVEEGPLLLVCNHPNFMLDSMVVTSLLRRPLWYLAKSTLFRGVLVSELLDALHVIPVYRRQDNPEDVTKNKETFARAVGVLRRRDAIVLFPEGVSEGLRKILPLKTGAARIAFLAEESSSYQLKLRIQPVGITYAELDKFRSSATVCFADPIELSRYRESYANDAVGTVRQLTQEIEDTLKRITVEVHDIRHQHLIEKIGKIYRSRGSALDDLERLKLIATNVEELSPRYPKRREEIESRIDDYLDLASVFHGDGSEPLEPDFDTLFTCLVLPFVLFGSAVSYLPYRFVGTLVARKVTHPVQQASFKFAAGIVIFPLWYIFLAFVGGKLLGGVSAGLALLIIFFYAGYYANNYLHEVRLYLLSALWPGRKKPTDLLTRLRDDLIEELEKLRIQ